MIAIELAFLQFLAPFALFACAVAMVVLRASGSRVFFDVVGTFQATRMLNDAGATATVLEALYLDSLMGIQEAGAELAEMFNFVDEVMPLTVEIENARVEFEKFVDNVDEAKALEVQLQDIGLAFGFAADEAFTAGARMAQLSGVLGGQGSTAVGTEMGMMFGAISGMGTEAAMQRLINLNQQTKFMTKNLEDGMTAQEKSNIIRRDTIRVLDQLNTVENRSAATMQQITFVMNQFASQAHLTNESIAAMAAMSATLIEAGEEQGKGGRALRMIYARLGADTNGARTFIENLGIAVVDAEGDMRPFSHVLQNLAVHYNTLNGEQKMQMAQQIAGNRHYTRLIKLLENVDRVRELELEAMLAQFPARDELQRRLDSEVFKYEQAEAALKNYSAAFGNTLLPAMTAVTEQQTLFYKTLAGIAEGPLGVFLTSFVMMSKLMSNFIGPTMNMIITLKNLQVAMQTQNLVARALRGEQIAGNNAMREGNTLTGMAIQYKNEMRTVTEASNNVTSLEANQLREQIVARIETINKLKEQVLTEKEMNVIVQEKMNNLRQTIMTEEEMNVTVGAKINKLREEGMAEEELNIVRAVSIAKLKQQQQVAAGAIMTEEEMKMVKDALIAKLKEEQMTTQQVNSARGGQIKQINMLIAKLKELGITVEILTDDEMMLALSTDIAGNEMLQQSMYATKLTMSLGAVGAIGMMFSDSEKGMRRAMIMTTAAMALQMVQAYKSMSAMMAENAQKVIGIGATEGFTWANLRAIHAQHGFSAATYKSAHALWVLDKGIKMILLKTVVFLGIVLLIEAAANALGLFKSPDMSGLDEMNQQMADTGLVLDYLKLSETELNGILQEQTRIIEGVGEANESADQMLKQAAQPKIDAANQVLGMYALEKIAINENKDAIWEYIEAQQTLDDLKEDKPGWKDEWKRGGLWLQDKGSSAAGWMAEHILGIKGVNEEMDKLQDNAVSNWFVGGAVEDRNEALKIIEDFGVDFVELQEWMTGRSFETWDAFERAFMDFIDVTRNPPGAGDMFGSVKGSISAATDEIYNFNNAREEMFFGFSSDRLTGNLVRQVHQQGVETLITSTEVIMHNNFNGMTTKEVADEILDEIMSGGIKEGYNFATV